MRTILNLAFTGGVFLQGGRHRASVSRAGRKLIGRTNGITNASRRLNCCAQTICNRTSSPVSFAYCLFVPVFPISFSLSIFAHFFFISRLWVLFCFFSVHLNGIVFRPFKMLQIASPPPNDISFCFSGCFFPVTSFLFPHPFSPSMLTLLLPLSALFLDTRPLLRLATVKLPHNKSR